MGVRRRTGHGSWRDAASAFLDSGPIAPKLATPWYCRTNKEGQQALNYQWTGKAEEKI